MVSMTQKQLEDLGLSKEQAESVLKINEDDVENAKSVSPVEVKNLQKEVSGLKEQVSERDRQLEELKETAGNNETLTKQIAELQEENKTARESHESEMNQLKIDFAVEKALTGAKAKNIQAVKALIDLTDAKLDKEGNVKGLQEQIDKLAAAEDTSFLFDQQQQTFRSFQPGTSAQQKPGAEVDTSKMNYDELCAYMEANPDA